MAVMKESAWLSAAGARGKVKSLLVGVFAAVAVTMALVLAAAWMITGIIPSDFTPRVINQVGEG